MSATPARIGFVIEPYRRAISVTAGVKDKHGNLARQSPDPVDSWFAELAAAQFRADERQGLLSPERRRFQIVTSDIEGLEDLLDSQDTFTATMTDTERGVQAKVMITDITIDLATQLASFNVWGA